MKTELEYARLNALLVKLKASWIKAFKKTSKAKAERETKKAS